METFAMPRLTPLAEELVASCLEHMPGRITKVGPRQWRYALPGERKARTEITVQGDCAVVERILTRNWYASRSPTMQRIWRHLDPRFSTASGARPVLPPGETKVRMRAERFIVATRRNERALVAPWLEKACTDSAAFAAGTAKADTNFNAMGPEATSGISQQDILDLCELEGWPAEARSASREVAVGLPARGNGICHGIVAPDGDTVTVHVGLEISGGAESPLCQNAAGTALLRLAGSVRLIRSTAAPADGRIVGRLDVRLQPPVDAQTLNDALSALAFAHQQIAPELAALAGDDSLADAYLRMQGAR